MLKKSALLFSLSLFTLSCLAADPFKGMSPEEIANVVNAMPSSSGSTPAPSKSWWESINGAISTIGSSFTKESIDKAEGLAKSVVHESVEKLNKEVMPVLRQNLQEGLAEGEQTLKAVVDHTSEAVQHAVDYTGATLQNNLNNSVSHTAHELASNVIPAAEQSLHGVIAHTSIELTTQVIPANEQSLRNAATHSAAEFKAVLKSTMVACCLTFVAFFGAKIAYDGVNEYFEEDGKDKTKPLIKVGLGSACFVAATYGVWKQF